MNTVTGWEPSRLKRFMRVYNVSSRQLSQETNIPVGVISRFLFNGHKERMEAYFDILDVFFEAKKKAKIEIFRSMITLYENYS